MSPLRAVLLATTLAFCLPAVALAQNASPPMQDKPASMQQGGNSGTSQDGGMGATGWSGPHRGQTSSGNAESPAAPDSPDKQPAVATGVDLNGPPKEFPSNKTPE